jgi:hypothetical protein
LTVSSDVRSDWWWDDTFGSALVGPPYVEEFAIGAGVENHAFRGGSPLTTATLDLDTPSGCAVGWTLLTSANDSPGP